MTALKKSGRRPRAQRFASVAFVASVAFTSLSSAAPAAAETAKAFTISADIVTGCQITLAAGGNWGKITLPGAAGIQSGTVQADLLSGSSSGIQLECTPGTQLSVTADTGNQPISGVRQLGISGNPAARIPYQLYANGSPTPWTTQSVALAFPVGTSKQLFPVSATATLPGQQRAGTYTDTVRITLAW